MKDQLAKVYQQAEVMIKHGQPASAINSILTGEIVVLTSAIKHLTETVESLGDLMQAISVSKLADVDPNVDPGDVSLNDCSDFPLDIDQTGGADE